MVDRQLNDSIEDDRTIVNLLTDQVEFANIILLNKVDLVTEEHLGILRSTLKKLNPSARIIESNFSRTDSSNILHTGLFNFEEAEQNAGWIAELNKEQCKQGKDDRSAGKARFTPKPVNEYSAEGHLSAFQLAVLAAP